MTYWFVKFGKPKNITIKYSESEHQQTKQELTVLLSNLEAWLQNYQQFHTDFPHQPDCETSCRFYQDFSAAAAHQKTLKPVDEIEEVSI
jgi:hypothetical protein